MRNEVTGEIEHRLYLLQNPWRFEQYIGPWNDKDPRWTENYKSQAPWEDLDDGKFFIDISTFKEYFLYFLIQYHRDDFKVSYFDKRDDEGQLARYTFTTTYTQDLHIAGDTYDPRMYPYGCKNSKVMA